MLKPEEDKILIDCRQFITGLSLQYQDMRRVLYDDRLAFFLEDRVADFAIEEQIASSDLLTARLAALFYPMGFRINTRSPKQGIWPIAKTFLQQKEITNNIIADVETTLTQAYGQMPQHKSAQLLSDALVGLHFDTETEQWASLRQLEYDLLNGPNDDRIATAQLKLQELLAIRFSTNAGRRYWQVLLGQQLLLQKKKVEKLLRSTKQANNFETNPILFSELEDGTPIRATQTFFRAIYRNHINLSAIADTKANIMISVNSILISVLITFLSYRNIAETQPMILVPVIVFLVVGLASLVFAVLSARPKVTSDATKKVNVAFFGSFVHLSEDAYHKAMNEVLTDGSLLYANMVSDLYYLGKVLDQKYRYLSIAYNIFMLGLVVTVSLFLFTLFVS